MRAAGRGRGGALGAAKPDRLWVPSQKGLMPDFPHRHSATVSRPGSISSPSWSTSRNSPRTIRGPSRYGVIVAPPVRGGPPAGTSSRGGSVGTGLIAGTVLPCPARPGCTRRSPARAVIDRSARILAPPHPRRRERVLGLEVALGRL